MSIQVIEDEADKQARGLREQRQEVVKRNRGRPKKIQEEIVERDLEASMLKNPKDGYRYKWVNRRYSEGERVQMHEGNGYETVTKDNDKTIPVVGVYKDGGWVRGDLVLMRTPVNNYLRRKRKADEKLGRLSRAHIDEAKDNINRMARDGRLIGPHKEAAFEQMKEGQPFVGPSAHDLGD